LSAGSIRSDAIEATMPAASIAAAIGQPAFITRIADA
jgi:hypothetical protein